MHHKANDMIMFNQKKTASEMQAAGLVGHVFADAEFQQKGFYFFPFRFLEVDS